MTIVDKNRSLAPMRALAKILIPSLRWRHHGIGVLQGYVTEDVEPEIRLHVWARSLIKPGIDASGDIHDHRFFMVSHVLAGVIGHEEVAPVGTEDGDFAMMALTHARAAKDSAYHGPTTPLPGKFKVRRYPMDIKTGQSYRFMPGCFHRSTPPLEGDIAVTCVEKHEQSDGQARLLYPIATPPVMAFGHELDAVLVRGVLARAAEVLGQSVEAWGG